MVAFTIGGILFKHPLSLHALAPVGLMFPYLRWLRWGVKAYRPLAVAPITNRLVLNIQYVL